MTLQTAQTSLGGSGCAGRGGIGGADDASPDHSPSSSFVSRFCRNRTALVSLVVLLLIVAGRGVRADVRAA